MQSLIQSLVLSQSWRALPLCCPVHFAAYAGLTDVSCPLPGSFAMCLILNSTRCNSDDKGAQAFASEHIDIEPLQRSHVEAVPEMTWNTLSHPQLILSIKRWSLGTTQSGRPTSVMAAWLTCPL